MRTEKSVSVYEVWYHHFGIEISQKKLTKNQAQARKKVKFSSFFLCVLHHTFFVKSSSKQLLHYMVCLWVNYRSLPHL